MGQVEYFKGIKSFLVFEDGLEYVLIEFVVGSIDVADSL